jgi:glycerol-3-phosphate acyltransferase PlsY
MDWSDYAILAASLVAGYLLGSIPFGLILTHYAGLGDIRAIGSGNIGATNVLRTGRKGLAAATLILDALKGVVAVLLASLISPEAGLAAALGAFLGHLFPVWLGFRGGKGVATYLGTLLAVFWPAGLIFAAIWLAAVFLSRRSSVGALAASTAGPVALFAFRESAAGWIYLLMTVLLWWKHHENIRRLIAGTEARIGEKK